MKSKCSLESYWNCSESILDRVQFDMTCYFESDLWYKPLLHSWKCDSLKNLVELRFNRRDDFFKVEILVCFQKKKEKSFLSPKPNTNKSKWSIDLSFSFPPSFSLLPSPPPSHSLFLSFFSPPFCLENIGNRLVTLKVSGLKLTKALARKLSCSSAGNREKTSTICVSLFDERSRLFRWCRPANMSWNWFKRRRKKQY